MRQKTAFNCIGSGIWRVLHDGQCIGSMVWQDGPGGNGDWSYEPNWFGTRPPFPAAGVVMDAWREHREAALRFDRAALAFGERYAD